MDKKWSAEEEKTLIEIHHLYNLCELAEYFNRSKNSIKCKKRKLGLCKKREKFPEGMKKCPRCKEVLKLECFHKNKSEKSGRSTYCKKCSRQYDKERSNVKKIKNEEQKIKNEEHKKTKKIEEYKEKNKNLFSYCTKCKEEKTVDDFYFNVSKNGYIRISCKKCASNRNKKNQIERIKKRGY